MKYKIKVEVMQDGSSYYYPMVKKHWWQPWRYIDKWATIDEKRLYDTEEDAQEALKSAKERIDNFTISRTYSIPYKEEKQ